MAQNIKSIEIKSMIKRYIILLHIDLSFYYPHNYHGFISNLQEIRSLILNLISLICQNIRHRLLKFVTINLRV